MKVSYVSQLVGVLAISLAVVNTPATGQEHPTQKSSEHPTEKKSSEHPGSSSSSEHPEKKAKDAAKSGVTMPDLAAAIKQHIKSESKEGKFQVRDDQTKEVLALELDHVHDERLSRIDDDSYFACVDMKSASGTVYDVDFILKGTSKDNVKIKETAIHKVDGKARYTWKEEGGLWKKQETAAKPAQ